MNGPQIRETGLSPTVATKETTMPPKKPPKKPRTVGPELAFQAEVLALCEGRNLWPVLVNPARFTQRAASNRGFPDLVIYGPGGAIHRELKISLGYGRGLSPAQTTWRNRLQAAGQDWAIWTPRELRDGSIERELDAIETPRADADPWPLAMLGITHTAAEPAAEPGQAAEPAEDDDADGDTGDDAADTVRKVAPWLLAAGALVTAVCVIKHQ